MLKVLDDERCCGCSACSAACVHDAIIFKLDKEGFEYPQIDREKCVDCRLCQSVCPVIQFDDKRREEKTKDNVSLGYVARNRNYDQRLVSSSGSIFPPIAEYILEKSGVVVGVMYDADFNVVHSFVEKKDDLWKLQGSKYLQCKADATAFRRIKNELKTGRLVLYSAMACQIEGLKSFLHKEYENLYTIDLICMGIPSYDVWQKYLNAFYPNEKIQHVNFKEKSVGWNSFNFFIKTDKRDVKERGMENLYLRSMFLTWNMRPSCFLCPFKREKRISDFTLADAWGTNKLFLGKDDNKGISSVIIHSSKGKDLWLKLNDRIESNIISIDDITAGNDNLIRNKVKSGDRTLFYSLLHRSPKKAFVQLCSLPQPSFMTKVVAYIKKQIKSILNAFKKFV